MKWNDNFVPLPHAYRYWHRAGFFETQIKKLDLPIRELPDDIDSSHTIAPSAHEIDVLEENTQTNEQRLNHLLDNKEILQRRHAELIELRYVLRETATFFAVVCHPMMLNVLMIRLREDQTR